MRLDLVTLQIGDVTITAILGALLFLSAGANQPARSLKWWGCAHLLLAAGIGSAGLATAYAKPALLHAGMAGIALAYGVMWNAARLFDRRRVRVIPMLVGAALWIVALAAGVLESIDDRIIVGAAIVAAYCVAVGAEYWRGRDEPLLSRWPAVILMGVIAAGYLCWILLALVLPLDRFGSVLESDWSSQVILMMLLCKIAMAFIVLSLAKERLELKQRLDALTDPLTRLPNRRAFFRAAARRVRRRSVTTGPVAALVFDLDHFRRINEEHGPSIGDRVLQLFAATMTDQLKPAAVIGRIGGGEFAAVIPRAELADALNAAERLIAAFAEAAGIVEGVRVGATVSAGVAVADRADCNLPALLQRADSALLAAKRAGRNRVEVARPTGLLGKARAPELSAATSDAALAVGDRKVESVG